AKIAVGAFACSFPVSLGTASAMREIPPVLVQVGRSFQLTSWQMSRMIYLPALARPLATALQISLGVAFSACLIAEMRFATAGLGYLVISSYDRSRFAEVCAMLALIVVIAGTLNSVLALATASRAPPMPRVH
ncbi:MAG: ABC transporter permease subunit, partial [Planctomycetaceae bacterium]|nr:ABC transporter permease subunit [Planctomycetaceae bacterium]